MDRGGALKRHPVGTYTAAARLAFAAAGEPQADCDQLFQHAGQLTNARGALDQKLPFTHGIARKVPEEPGLFGGFGNMEVMDLGDDNVAYADMASPSNF